MARPVKVRKVDLLPEENYFKPMGRRKCQLEEVELKVEELEAMRLKDMEALSQEECARQMEVSRQTFQNILDSARKKMTMALVEGKAIRIGGGDFAAKQCLYHCKSCGHIYSIQYKIDQNQCPKCGSNEVSCGQKACGCRKNCSLKDVK